ncbi:helix-turn-helix transcriptional regulator [Streptomyces sp. CBG31]|uniref:helix-turn-helix domain-containing protein n=1 Tax=Streptomyces sp. CBG31 TaxID=2762623 RepID=UPI0028F6E72A|nr:helix-turn-helix transcriptional regulator [Streptomyces sp. CBG31]
MSDDERGGERAPGGECAREALAERLRELREGSGRTYASLARRIGVSASTLHRYCTGQTVPAEFAPVERMARLCGRTPEERESLHRLWLRADADRVERMEAGAASGLGAGAGAGADAPLAGGPHPPGGSVPPAGPGLPPAPVPPVPTPVRRVGNPPAHAGAPPSARRWGRALSVCGLVAVLALALTGSLPERNEGGRPRRRRPLPRSPGPVTITSGSTAAGTPTSSPGPRPPSRRPRPRPTRRAGRRRSARCTRVRPRCGSPSRAGTSGPCAGGAADPGGRAAGAGRRSGAPDEFRVRWGAHTTDVRRGSRQGAARGRSVPGNDTGEPIPAVSFPYRVSASDPEVLLVTARAARCDCDWVAELRWSGGGRSGTVRIDDGGRPFRTSGAPGRPVHDYDHGAGRWVVGP